MSLQVWLPLNGDLNQQGISTSTVTVSTATIDNNGKIGKCYSFTEGQYIGIDANNINNHKYSPLSIAMWVYPTQNDSSERYLISCYESGGAGIHLQNSKLDFVIYVSGYKHCISQTITLNTWHHVCGVYDGVNSYIYVDGELHNTLTANGTITYHTTCPWEIGGNPGGASWASGVFVGKINDVRIYDNALSETEIKKLSQGLVLHLPLNNNGLGNENLHKNSDTITSTWTINQGTVSDGVATITPTSNTHRRIYQLPANGAWSWQSGVTYTASIDAKSSNGAILAFYPYGAGSMSKTYTVTSEWKRYSFTFTATKAETGSITYMVNQTSGVTLQLRHPKLELGDKATPWSPNPLDEDYPDYGPGIPQNLLSGTPKGSAPTSYCFSQLNLLENLQTGKTYTLQLWNVNVSHSAKTVEQTGVWVYWGGGNIKLFNWAGSTYFTNGHADYLSKTFTVTESHARGSGSANKWLNLYNSVPSVSGTLSASIEKWKLEESSTASDYTPAITDAAYKEEGYNNRAIFDQSGYCRNCANNNKIIYSSDSPKYNVSMFFDGTNRISTSVLPAETKTISVWVKTTKNKSTAQCICGDSASALCLFFYSGGLVTYFKGSAGGTGSRVTFGSEYKENDWNHFVVVKTGDTTRDVYCNGILLTPAANNYYSPATGLWIGQRNATGALPFYGYLSDFRAYVTALSEKDILSLYNNNAYIDSNNNIHGKIRD